jgi:hypothetical protein
MATRIPNLGSSAGEFSFTSRLALSPEESWMLGALQTSGRCEAEINRTALPAF